MFVRGTSVHTGGGGGDGGGMADGVIGDTGGVIGGNGGSGKGISLRLYHPR